MKVLKLSGKSSLKIIFIFSLTLLSFLIGCNSSPGNKDVSSAKPDQVRKTTNETGKQENISATPLSADSLQSLLKGKWLREDGTYSIEIFSVGANGLMDAGYFNPNPINVGKSGWVVTEGNIMLEIILKDVNYPGSKYNLFYDRKSGCLIGNYFQAVQGLNYDVRFFRNK